MSYHCNGCNQNRYSIRLRVLSNWTIPDIILYRKQLWNMCIFLHNRASALNWFADSLSMNEQNQKVTTKAYTSFFEGWNISQPIAVYFVVCITLFTYQLTVYTLLNLRPAVKNICTYSWQLCVKPFFFLNTFNQKKQPSRIQNNLESKRWDNSSNTSHHQPIRTSLVYHRKAKT